MSKEEILFLLDLPVVCERIVGSWVLTLKNHRTWLTIPLCNAWSYTRMALNVELDFVLIEIAVSFSLYVGASVWVRIVVRFESHTLLRAYEFIPNVFGSQPYCRCGLLCENQCLVVFHTVSNGYLWLVTGAYAAIRLNHHNVCSYSIDFGIHVFYVYIFIWLVYLCHLALLAHLLLLRGSETLHCSAVSI